MGISATRRATEGQDPKLLVPTRTSWGRRWRGSPRGPCTGWQRTWGCPWGLCRTWWRRWASSPSRPWSGTRSLLGRRQGGWRGPRGCWSGRGGPETGTRTSCGQMKSGFMFKAMSTREMRGGSCPWGAQMMRSELWRGRKPPQRSWSSPWWPLMASPCPPLCSPQESTSTPRSTATWCSPRSSHGSKRGGSRGRPSCSRMAPRLTPPRPPRSSWWTNWVGTGSGARKCGHQAGKTTKLVKNIKILIWNECLFLALMPLRCTSAFGPD